MLERHKQPNMLSTNALPANPQNAWRVAYLAQSHLKPLLEPGKAVSLP